MRMIMRVKLPVESFNNLVRNGTAGEVMNRILGDLKPEAAYFTTIDGHRGGIIVLNMDSAADMPRIAEPWFLTFNADVSFHPAMTPEDLAGAGLDSIGKQWA